MSGRFQILRIRVDEHGCYLLGAQPTLKKAKALLSRENVTGWIYDQQTGRKYE